MQPHATGESEIQLGPFDLIEPVGRGAMGEVWLARHRAQGTRVAVKFLLGDFAGDRWALDAFANEVRAAAGLTHPAIVAVLDHGVVDADTARSSRGRLKAESPFIVMAWVEGESLGRHMGQLPWRQTLPLLLQLLDALAHSHAHGVIHRDLKPGNVILSRDLEHPEAEPRAVLTDFGLARAFDRQATPERMVAGTPAYMAPEQLTGDWRDQGPWTDLYAFGCLAWAMVSGDPPYGRNVIGFDEAREAHLERPPPRLEARMPVPVGLEGWLRRLMVKDPAARYSRAADAAWGLLCLGEAPAADPQVLGEAPTEEESPPPRREDHPTNIEAARDNLVALQPLTDMVPTIPGLSHFGDDGLDESTETMTDGGGRTDPGSVEVALGSRPSQAARAPIPGEWRRKGAATLARHLVGVGLNLYGLRAVPIIDREQERDALWAAMRDVNHRRRAAAILLRGPSGAGKSRLADWLGERADEVAAATVLRASLSDEAGGSSGLVPMLARMLKIDGLRPPEALQRLRRILPRYGLGDSEDLAAINALLHEGGGRAEPRARHALVRRLLAALAHAPGGDRITVVILDDIHWSADTIDFTRHLLEAQDTDPTPILVLATVQEETLAGRPETRSALDALLARREVAALDIGPLPPAEHAALVRQLLGMGGDLADRVARRTAGNPLFAVHLIGDWVARGLLEPGPDGFHLRPRARLDIPEDLHHTWSARISHMLEGFDPTEARALELAAVIGMEVDADEWEAVCAIERAQPSTRLREALVRQRLARVTAGGSSFTFAHPMIRESLERLADEDRRLRRHHLACAQMLRDRGGDGRGFAERMSRHLLLAGDLVPAEALLLRAVDERLETDDFEAAERLLNARDRALRFLRLPTEDELWGRGWLARARMSRLAGKLVEAEAQLERVREGARRHGWHRLEAEGLIELSGLLRARGQLRDAATVLSKMTALAFRVGDPLLMAQGQLAHGRLLIQLGELASADAVLRAALELFVEEDAYRDRAAAEEQLARVAMLRGEYETARNHALEVLAHHKEAGNRMGVAEALNELGENARLAGDVDRAIEHYREALARYDQMGMDKAGIPAVNLGLCLILKGRASEARPMLQRALTIFRKQEEPPMIAATQVCLLSCHAADGDWRAWDQGLEEARVLLAKTGFVDVDNAQALRMAARLAVTRGEQLRARAAFDVARQQADTLGQPGEEEASP